MVIFNHPGQGPRLTKKKGQYKVGKVSSAQGTIEHRSRKWLPISGSTRRLAIVRYQHIFRLGLRLDLGTQLKSRSSVRQEFKMKVTLKKIN